jgi:hypothetical protein
MRYRLGRHNKQLVYSQQGSEPSNDDVLVLFTIKPGLAQTVVDALNADLGPEIDLPYCTADGCAQPATHAVPVPGGWSDLVCSAHVPEQYRGLKGFEL